MKSGADDIESGKAETLTPLLPITDLDRIRSRILYVYATYGNILLIVITAWLTVLWFRCWSMDPLDETKCAITGLSLWIRWIICMISLTIHFVAACDSHIDRCYRNAVCVWYAVTIALMFAMVPSVTYIIAMFGTSDWSLAPYEIIIGAIILVGLCLMQFLTWAVL